MESSEIRPPVRYVPYYGKSLDISCCDKITDKGITALASGLP